MDPISAIGLVTSIVQTISAVGELIRYVNTVHRASEEQAVLAREVASFASFLTGFRYDIERFDLSRPEYAGLLSLTSQDGPLVDMQLATTHLLRKLRRRRRLPKVFQSLKWPLEKLEVEQMLSLIERLKSTISLSLATDNIRLVARIDTGITDLKNHQQDHEHQAILRWISDLDFSKRQDDYLERCHAGTGKWFLEHDTVRQWLGEPPQTLWCHGQPGSGKTILTSLLVHTLRQKFGQQQKIGIAYIYFNYKEEQTQTAENMIASLLEQLARAQPDMQPDLLSTYKLYMKKGGRPPLSELATLLQGEVQRLSRTFFFVDALDECSRQDGNLERFITAIRPLQPTAHLIVTSRLSPSSINAGGLEANLVMEIKALDADVRCYLDGRMQSEERLSRLLRDDASLRAAVADRITENAQGMFLLAQLQMDFVARKNNRRDIRRSLGNLPRQLSDVYEAALRRIANQNQEDTDLAERLLSWIVCARRPLTRVEVQHALAVEQADKRLDEEGIPDDQILIAACAGLVTVDRESSIIRPVHYTAQKYFEAAFASRLPRFRVAIASACLTYLSFDDLGDACELDSLLRRYALLPYAAQYWGDHVRGEPEAALREEVVAFCRDQPHITTWYRVLHRLRHGYELDAASLARVTGLHAAALLGLPETVASLLRFQDVDINALDIQGETPLHWAAAQGHEDVVGILLGHATVDANRSSLYGRTPLSLAAEGGHAGVVSLLVARKDVDPDQNDPNLGITPLWIAADRGHIDVVRLLLGHAGVDVNVKDKYFGETPLWRAANKGHEEVVREILKRRDVNVGVRDRHYGEQPLDRARAGGYKKIIEMLETHEGAAPDHYYT